MCLASYVRTLYRGYGHLQGHVFLKELKLRFRIIIITSKTRITGVHFLFLSRGIIFVNLITKTSGGDHGVIFWPFDPAKNAIPRWCTGRRWHILMAVMRGNCVGGNWLMKWDELKNSHGTLIDWCTRREWPVNCITVISAWWRLNIRFQRSSGWSCGRWIII